ncbi:hypothetical protein F0562_021211 [Nyssa sinensis]|uniref:Uncharacterized protein n=1 Tax=Nyssa sinensis TaxID=561372 RepID=A0A5J5BKM9_9ASTE|nr:hypothetical protein F0562_021211 [Nyssa sinensis]
MSPLGGGLCGNLSTLGQDLFNEKEAMSSKIFVKRVSSEDYGRQGIHFIHNQANNCNNNNVHHGFNNVQHDLNIN